MEDDIMLNPSLFNAIMQNEMDEDEVIDRCVEELMDSSSDEETKSGEEEGKASFPTRIETFLVPIQSFAMTTSMDANRCIARLTLKGALECHDPCLTRYTIV
jgi:hypothetical protein